MSHTRGELGGAIMVRDVEGGTYKKSTIVGLTRGNVGHPLALYGAVAGVLTGCELMAYLYFGGPQNIIRNRKIVLFVLVMV